MSQGKNVGRILRIVMITVLLLLLTASQAMVVGGQEGSMVQRASADDLKAAEAIHKGEDQRKDKDDAEGQEEALRRRIEESRYDQG